MSVIFSSSSRSVNRFEAFLLLGMTVFLAQANGAVADRLAVIVGNTVFTESEVIEEVRITEFLNGEPLDLGPAARRAAAERLVDQQLIRNEMALSALPQPGEQEAAEMVQQFIKTHFRDESEYRAALAKFGLSDRQVRDHLRWQLTAIRFTDQRFRRGSVLAPQAPPPAQGRTKTEAARNEASRSIPESGNSGSRNRANWTDVPETNTPAAADTDEALNAWLKEMRGRTRVQLKKEAFE